MTRFSSPGRGPVIAGAESRRDAVDSHGNELHGEVIDVTSYPVHPPLPLPTTVPKPQGE